MIPPEASLLRIYLNANDRWHHRSLYQAVVEKARAMDLAGASVFGVELSFGANQQLRDAKSEYRFVDIPVVVEVVDAPERIEALLLELSTMIGEGLVTISPVRVVRYAHPTDRGSSGG
jgi:PII-like signaling protein